VGLRDEMRKKLDAMTDQELREYRSKHRVKHKTYGFCELISVLEQIKTQVGVDDPHIQILIDAAHVIEKSNGQSLGPTNKLISTWNKALFDYCHSEYVPSNGRTKRAELFIQAAEILGKLKVKNNNYVQCLNLMERYFGRRAKVSLKNTVLGNKKPDQKQFDFKLRY
jgi:hypothetical protein